MIDFPTALEVLDLESTVLANMDNAEAGYELVSVSMPDEAWRRVVATSPVVDGEFPVQESLAAGVLEAIVRIKGDTWPQVEGRRIALRETWAARPAFLLRLTRNGVSVTYRARRPDITGSVATIDRANNRRVLAYSFPVQPNPTVTGV